MTEKELLETAESRIKKVRTAEVELIFTDIKGTPVKNTKIHVHLKRHEFKLGCNGFGIRSIEDKNLLELYEKNFSELLNYATLPFYWAGYEHEKGKTQEAKLVKMAEWCKEKNITVKGHPLTWHEVFPKWAESIPDNEVLKLQEERINNIVSKFKGEIDIWDVINETTVSYKFNNTIQRWVKDKGAVYVVSRVLKLAQEANIEATLLYNDFNISADYEKLAEGLINKKAPVHAFGIQSHMHTELWPIEKAWQVCETYGRFKLPLHFTELTILSGIFKDKEDNDWHKVHTDWLSTSEGETFQLEYGKKLFTVLFSHPSVEAITWWDFSDLNSWQGAPSGLVRKDMSPKPLYKWLKDAFHKYWSTDVNVKTDSSGRIKLNAFFGEYEFNCGKSFKGSFTFKKTGGRKIEIVLK